MFRIGAFGASLSSRMKCCLVVSSVFLWTAVPILAQADEISVRLSGDPSAREGRVEVRRGDGDWGTVCTTGGGGWDLREATVVCRSLGRRYAVSASAGGGGGRAGDGGGRLPVWLAGVVCEGDETGLANCSTSGWGRHSDCPPRNNAGVVCSEATHSDDDFLLPVGSIRLVGGRSPTEGRVEVYIPHQWGRVCDRDWHRSDAAVVCRQLGYHSVLVQGAWLDDDDTTTGARPLLLASAHCEGTERRLVDCRNASWDGAACLGRRAIGVVCSNSTGGNGSTATDIAEVDYRLAYGIRGSEGLVQAGHRAQRWWYPICGDSWTGAASRRAHRLLCRHLGFDDVTLPSSYAVPRSGRRTGLAAVVELGDQSFEVSCAAAAAEVLTDCTLVALPRGSCASAAGLRCTAEDDGGVELRLVNSKREGAGIILGRASPAAEWGAICRRNWDIRDTDVACRHLGFPAGAATAFESTVWDDGTDGGQLDSTFLSSVGCYGNESDVSQCDLVSVSDVPCSSFTYIECVTETRRYDVPAFLCGDINQCGFGCDQGPHNDHRQFVRETCRCDALCRWFGDCCYDYASSCDPSPDWTSAAIGGVGIENYACALVPGPSAVEGTGFSLVSLCPRRWADAATRQNCESAASDEDAIRWLPVYDAEGAVYKNVFCAVCHGVRPIDIQKWGVMIVHDSSDNRTFDERFGLSVHGNPTGYIYVPPVAGSVGSARPCPARTVRSCPDHAEAEPLRAACAGYYAPLRVNGTLYHNPHCALCNGELVEPTATCWEEIRLCPFQCGPDKWSPCFQVCQPPFPFPGVTVLFDFGWGGGDDDDGEEEGAKLCRAGQLYDRFLQRCRTVHCRSGLTNGDGECLDEADPSLPGPINPDQPAPLLDDRCSALVASSLGPVSLLLWRVFPLENPEPPMRSVDAERDELGLSVLVEGLLGETESISQEAMWSRFGDGLRDLDACRIAELAVYLPAGLLRAIEACSNFTAAASDAFGVPGNDSSSQFTVSRLVTLVRVDGNVSGESLLPNVCLDVLGLNCSRVDLLLADEYAAEGNGSSIRHTARGRRFGAREFVLLPDGKAAVCGPLNWTDPNQYALGLLSLVLSCLSVLALAAVLFTYGVFPELRNTAGIYIMNLVVALLLALVVSVLSSALALVGRGCVISAYLIHLSWLAAFLWMAAVSCDVARTFTKIGGVVARRYRVSRGRLSASMALVWGGALTVSSVCLGLHLCECTGLPPIYGRSRPCWVASARVNLVVFGAPVAASLLVSLACFVLIVRSIRRSRRETKVVRSKRRAEEILNEMKIYGKLVVLFGTAWILAFIADVVNHVVLDYVTVIVNALQGSFIFLAFGLNGRVRALWRQAFASRAHCNAKSMGETDSVPRGTGDTAITAASDHQDTQL